MKFTLPTDSKLRKNYPIATGCDEYFPAALAGVARHSFLAGARHTPGQPMHHNRQASMDHTDCIRRHMLDIADMVAAFERAQAMAAQYGANEFIDSGGPEHLTVLIAAILDEANALAWRALAYSQMLHETYGGAPLAPAARNVPTDPNAMCDAIDAYGGERCTRSAGHSGAHHSALTDFSFPEPAPLSPEEHVMLHGASDVLVVRAREHTCAIGSDEPCAVCDETAPPPVLDNDPDDPVRGFDAAD